MSSLEDALMAPGAFFEARASKRRRASSETGFSVYTAARGGRLPLAANPAIKSLSSRALSSPSWLASASWIRVI